MAETEEQPNLDGKDKVECPTAEPEHRGSVESDSSKSDYDDERKQVSGSETTTSKASEPRPEPLLLDKQQTESSDQNEADRGEANTTTTENEDSGEQFEVVQLSSFGKEKPPKEMEGMTVTTTLQAAGGSDTGEGTQAETKEPDRENEACEEEPALQADREDQETAAPSQTEETGADSGRTTPKEEGGTGLGAEKEGERDDSSSQQQEQKKGEEEQASQDASETRGTPTEAVGDGDELSQKEEEEEEESDEKMEVEASPVAAGRVDEGIDSEGAGDEQEKQEEEEEEGGGVAEDTPEMESRSRTDSPVQPLEMESKGEAESGETVALVSDAATQPMEEDIQKEGEKLSETKMETEYTKDENNDSIESEDMRKDDTTPEVGIPPETNMETGNETATGPVSPFKDDMETENVTVAQPPTIEESGSATIAKPNEEENSNLKSTSPPVEDKQVESEPAKDNEGNIDMAEDTPPPSSHDEREGEIGGEERDDDNEEGLPLVQLGGATDRAPVEQAADKGSVQEQEECALKETLRAGDTKSMEAEPTVVKQDSEHPKSVETTEIDDNPEKVESDIKQPKGLTETTEVEQRAEDDAFKLELSFGSSEPETVPSKDTSISVAADDEKSEIEKESEGAAVSKDAQEQAIEEDEKMDISESGVEGEMAVPDTQEESTQPQEPRDAESAIITDQSSKEMSSLAENVLDTSEKSPTTANGESEVMSAFPQQSEASEPEITTSSDDSSDQPLSSTEAPPTSSAAPPTSPPLSSTEAPPTSSAAPPTSPPLSSTETPPTSSAAPPTSPPLSSTEALPTSSAAPPISISTAADTASVSASLSTTESTPTSTSSTSTVKEAVTSVSASLSTTESTPTSTSSTSTVKEAVTSVSASLSTTESTPASTSSTSTVKEAVTCTIKTTVTVSTPPELRVDPSTVSKAPPTSSSSPVSPPPTSVPSPSIASPTTASSSSEEPPQAPPTDTPTSSSSSSAAPPTTLSSSSSEAPPKTTPTPAPAPSVAPPITSSSYFKVPSLTNVPSLSSLAARSTLSHVVSTTRAQAAAASKKPPSTAVQSTSIVGAKLPSFDAPGDVSSIPIVTIPAASKSVALPAEAVVSVPSTQAVPATQTVTASSSVTAKLPSFSSVLSTPGSIIAKTAIVSGSSHKSASVTEVSTATVSSSTSTPVSVAGKAISAAASAVTALSTAATKPSSTVELTSPSPSITTTAHHKVSQQQLPSPSAAKPHSNTISVITQLPASFTASKTASFTSPVAVSSSVAAAISGGGHHGVVLGAGSLQQREHSNIIVGMQGAERLKVGEAEVLQVSGDSDLHLQQQKIEVKSREEMMGKVPPQVAVIPPIIDLTRTPEYSQVEKLKGQGVSGGDLGKGGKSSSVLMGVAVGSSEGQQRGHGGEVKSVEKTSGVVMAGQELKSPIGELKASTHPVARRIWMSSCRPLDPASLERIGVDSKGTVYWYDGGKNMFQSPPSNDPAYKPSESELQLSCKSMVQWTAKLKDLRHSNIEADVKLAQTIKDQFLSRVRVATQRKPRDMSVIQKLQAVHSIRTTQLSSQQQQQQQQASMSTKPTITLTTSQAAAAAAAMANAGGAVAIATGGAGTTGTAADGIAAAQQKTAQIVQGSFPQGSILVVPHPTHPFHAVVPVFANTAVLMPQAAAAAATAVASTTTTASAAGAVVGSSPSASVVVSQSSTNEKKAKPASAGADGEGSKVPSSVTAVAAGATQAILVQAPTTSQSLAALQASPSTVIQLSNSRNNVPAVSAAETSKEGTPSKDRSTSSKQSSEAAAHVQQQTQKGGGGTTFTSPQTATIALHPSFLPQALASGMIAAVPGGGIKLQDYRQALALSAMMPVIPIKVGDPVKLSTIDFESKSIEISGEVPIKTVEVDKETGELVPVTVPVKRPELDQQQQKGVAVESENALSGKEGEESLKPKKLKAASEESHIDVEGESKKQSDDKTAKEREAAFSGHSSSEIMSAQLLLSLTGGPHKDWSAISTPPMPVSAQQQQQQPTDKASDSPTKSLLTKEPSVVLTPVSLKSSGRDETASPASSTSQHTSASSGRKRKQKPIASAKPDDDSATTTPTPKGKKGGRKAKQSTVQEESAEAGETTTETKSSSAKKKPANDKTATGDKTTPGRSKQFSPEELLVLLDIPPSSSSSAGKGSNKNKTPTAKAKGKAKDKSSQDGRYVLQSSNATAKMEELKASRAGKPMKEYVIETDSESADSSSSGTSSSRFSPDSGSSSESSSDSSSEEGGGGGEGSETKAKPLPKKAPARGSKGGVVRGRGGRGRGGRTQRKGKKEESSSGESSSEDDKEDFERRKKPMARARGGRARGGRGGRGPRGGAGRQETTPKQQGKGQRPGHIVSIPTNLLSHKPASGKKRKVAASKTGETEKATTADYIPDLPVDLATLYATKGGVDLGTLSELTKSVKDEDLDIGIVGGYRSKRTCVRMREEITKLQEILKDNGSPEVRPSPPARSRTTTAAKASTKARSSGRASDVGGGSGGGQESTTAVVSSSVSSVPVKKYRRPAYSQFTHKRRKRRKKQPEEEALWQPASRKGGSGESYKPVYLFSTFLANKAALAVEKNRYNSIIQFHQAQPKDPGFLRLPQTTEEQSKPQRGSISNRKQTDADSGEEEMSAKETKSTPRGQKRRNSGRTSDGGSATRRTRNSEIENTDRAPSPQPFLRSSRRLRQQRNRSNASPPLQSPTSPDGPRSPLPPSPPSGVRPRPRKTSQNTAAGGSGSAVQQRSLRRKRQQQHEESPTSPVPDLFETRRSQQVEEMDSPSDDEERGKEDELSDGGIGARKRARFDDGEADKNLLSSPSMQSPEQQRSIPAPNSREEENYTICHGTPVNKSASDDISSPKNWPPSSSSSSSHHHSRQHHQQQMQNQQQLQHVQHGGQYPHHPHHHQQQQQQQMRSHEQHMQQYAAAAGGATQPSTGHAVAAQHHQQQHRAPSTPSSEATTFSPSMLHPESSSSPGFDHRSAAVAAAAATGAGGGGHAAPGGAGLSSGGSGGGGSSGGRGSAADYAHRQHQLMSAAEHAHLRESNSSWTTAGLHPHQFQGVPGAYPGAYPPMYNPSIAGMHYHGQPMPSANYPYPMPYHWGHHHSSAAAAAAAGVPQLGEHMLQQQHHHHQQQQQQHRQAATSKEMPSHHEVLQHPHISGHTSESPQSSSILMRGGSSSSAQSVSVTSSSTAVGKPSSRGHYPSPQAAALHQLTSPGSATTPHALSHQVPHGAEHLPPGAHQAAAAAAASFPYGFDSSAHSLSHMHMLQQSQMQPQLTRPLPGVSPHHLPPHMAATRGLWYPSQHMAAHSMIPGAIGAEIPGHPAHSKKAMSKSSKSATSIDSDKNRNTNNNNVSIVVGAPTNQRAGEFMNANTVMYPSGAHSSSSSSSITPGATFSVENLAAPYSGAHVMGVLTTPITPPTGQGQRFGSSSAGEGSLPAVSSILKQTRQE